MPALDKLPTEVVLQIFDYLNVFEVENVARTFNRWLYGLALPMCNVWWTRNARRVLARFPSSSLEPTSNYPAFPGHIPAMSTDSNCFYNHVIDSKMYADVELDPTQGPYYRHWLPDLQKWLPLDDAWKWAPPASECPRLQPHHLGYTSKARHLGTPEQWHHFETEAQRLGLTPPKRLKEFSQNTALFDRVTQFVRGNAHFGPQPFKLPQAVDGVGGYLVHLHAYKMGEYGDYLYLDKKGTECVLFIENDPNTVATLGFKSDHFGETGLPPSGITVANQDSTDRYLRRVRRYVKSGVVGKSELKAATDDRVRIVYDIKQSMIKLAALSFDDYLITQCYDTELYSLAHKLTGQWAHQTRQTGIAVSSGLKRFVKDVYLPVPSHEEEHSADEDST